MEVVLIKGRFCIPNIHFLKFLFSFLSYCSRLGKVKATLKSHLFPFLKTQSKSQPGLTADLRVLASPWSPKGTVHIPAPRRVTKHGSLSAVPSCLHLASSGEIYISTMLCGINKDKWSISVLNDQAFPLPCCRSHASSARPGETPSWSGLAGRGSRA